MPDQPLSQHQIDVLVEAALAAPSMHNTQPWRFEINDRAIDVYLDRTRALPAEDPDGRALMISTGAAIFNLRCAAAHLDLDSWYGAAPAADEPDLVARIIVQPTLTPDRDLVKLYPQVARRHTSREPGRPVPLSADFRGRLTQAAASDGVQLTWLDPQGVQEVLRSGTTESLHGWADHARTVERARWISLERGDDGIPIAALGPRPAVFPAPVRDLGAGLPGRGRSRESYETEPVLAVLSSTGDGPADRLTAGIALERVLLTATQEGAHASFLNQALEYEQSRTDVQEVTGKPGFAQMVIRFSHSTITATTPRRAVADVVTVGPDRDRLITDRETARAAWPVSAPRPR